jgi:hypothetical protein
MSFLYGLFSILFRLMVFVSMEKFSKLIKIGYHILHIQACANCWKWSSSSHTLTVSFVCRQVMRFWCVIFMFHLSPVQNLWYEIICPLFEVGKFSQSFSLIMTNFIYEIAWIHKRCLVLHSWVNSQVVCLLLLCILWGSRYNGSMYFCRWVL